MNAVFRAKNSTFAGLCKLIQLNPAESLIITLVFVLVFVARPEREREIGYLVFILVFVGMYVLKCHSRYPLWDHPRGSRVE
jgi:hypothetical protein